MSATDNATATGKKGFVPVKIKIRDLAIEECQVTFSMEEEEDLPEWAFKDGPIDDEEQRKYNEQDRTWIRSELDKGNDWAWFCAKLTVSYGPLTSTHYLGHCSYASEADFRDSGTYGDMTDEALAELNEKLSEFMVQLFSRENAVDSLS